MKTTRVTAGPTFARNDTADHQLPTITMDVLRAGVAAYQRWDPEHEDIEALVAAIFYEVAPKAAADPVPGPKLPQGAERQAT